MMDKLYPDGWNRCDDCGKFIPYSDFEAALASRMLVTPDSLFTEEEYATLCSLHNPANTCVDSGS